VLHAQPSTPTKERINIGNILFLYNHTRAE
jgi:hypothetical protein